jgi:hypothetical protein
MNLPEDRVFCLFLKTGSISAIEQQEDKNDGI